MQYAIQLWQPAVAEGDLEPWVTSSDDGRRLRTSSPRAHVNMVKPEVIVLLLRDGADPAPNGVHPYEREAAAAVRATCITADEHAVHPPLDDATGKVLVQLYAVPHAKREGAR